MPDFHYVAFRTFAHATEDPSKVKRALAALAGDVPVTETVAEGSHGNPILILEAEVARAADVRAFFARIAEVGLLAKLADEVEPRLDDHGVFYARFSKQAAYEGRLELAADEDAIQMRAKAASFPASREGAKATLERFLAKALRR